MAVLCQTPEGHCTGGKVSVNARMGRSIKAHGNRTEAFNCYKRYLIEVKGYTQIGGREFRPPDGGPILVLTKKIRYGHRLRGGKEGFYRPNDPHSDGVIVG